MGSAESRSSWTRRSRRGGSRDERVGAATGACGASDHTPFEQPAQVRSDGRGWQGGDAHQLGGGVRSVLQGRQDRLLRRASRRVASACPERSRDGWERSAPAPLSWRAPRAGPSVGACSARWQSALRPPVPPRRYRARRLRRTAARIRPRAAAAPRGASRVRAARCSAGHRSWASFLSGFSGGAARGNAATLLAPPGSAPDPLALALFALPASSSLLVLCLMHLGPWWTSLGASANKRCRRNYRGPHASLLPSGPCRHTILML